MLARLGQWLSWYEKDGYLRDRPTANYYWGYLTTLTFAGLAAAGEAKAADDWSKTALRELSNNVLPAFTRSAGGRRLARRLAVRRVHGARDRARGAKLRARALAST